MQSIFRTAFYLRSNYVNKEGKTPVMLRIYLNNERMSLGSTGITIVQSQWDHEKERVKGRHTEALNTNLHKLHTDGSLRQARRADLSSEFQPQEERLHRLASVEPVSCKACVGYGWLTCHCHRPMLHQQGREENSSYRTVLVGMCRGGEART